MTAKINRAWLLVGVITLLGLFALAFAMPATAHAAQKTVWVITESTHAYSEDSDETQGVDKYTYTKNGLLALSNQNETAGRVASKFYWKYDKNGNYKKSFVKWKQFNSTTWQTTKYPIKRNKLKQVVSYDGFDAAYNKQGRCKKFGNYKLTYKKGYLAKINFPSAYVSTITRDAKGGITKCKSDTVWADSTVTSTFTNTYKSGRLVSWSRTYEASDNSYNLPVKATYTWKKISVPKKFVAKVKAQQRWILDNVPLGLTISMLPLAVVNK